ncbi:MAG: hypothetical protein CSA76_05930 [Spirochaetales bacterium]|nr:MAG: hypothetical protein CSA76_05930 [Spirochaetales bacterium]
MIRKQSGRKTVCSVNYAFPILLSGLAVILFILGPVLSVSAGEAELAPFRVMLEKSGFPENDETRRLNADNLKAPNYSAVETRLDIYRQMSDSRLVEFEVRKQAVEWYLIFRNQRGTEPWETFPIWGRGNWVVKRSLLDGAYIQAKIFIQDNEESFVRLFPMEGGRCRLDVYLYGRQLGDDVIVPASFESLLFSPFARIMFLTQRSIPWKTVFPNPERIGYRRVAALAEVLSLYSGSIQEIPDAGIDGGGLNAYIDSGDLVPAELMEPGKTGLNCSGYVKWVADGIYSAWSRAPGALFLDVEELKKPGARRSRNSWNESYSASGKDARNSMESLLRDPFFGLDWNRNIARIIREAQLGRALSSAEWAALDSSPLPGVSWVENMGYPLDALGTALYQLASAYPGKIWLAAVNSPFRPEPSADDPRPLSLHQYWHVAILAPWFDDGSEGREKGTFRVAVLDTGDVAESLLSGPSGESPAAFPRIIQDRAVVYARLGRDDNGVLQKPEVRVHLTAVELPENYQPSPLPLESP